jgi:hypothetical protein
MKKIYLLICCSFLCIESKAQADLPLDPDTGTSVPVDGGIVTVTLIAAAYGAKRKSKQNKESNDDI